MSSALTQAVLDAAGRSDVIEAVERVYADVAAAIAERQPVCEMSGRCCKFEQYGHRLYVSTLELAAFVAGEPKAPGAWDGSGCPYQRGKLCSVHIIRPFGCRMFFCDPTATDWQQGMYEQFHTRLKALHEELGVPYFYVEWRHALQELSASPDASHV